MWVKICGIRDVSTARAVADLGPNAIGLNFYAASPRSVDVRMAERIARCLPVEVEPVGVFVNHSVAEILCIAPQCGIATVQLHGDEPPESARELSASGLKVIRATRLDANDVAAWRSSIDAHAALGLRAVLVDSRVKGVYGGSGHVAPWTTIHESWQSHWPSLLLAGGLTPENVAESITQVRPWGVDTASGVESRPGVKDLARVQQFLHAARAVTSPGP